MKKYRLKPIGIGKWIVQEKRGWFFWIDVFDYNEITENFEHIIVSGIVEGERIIQELRKFDEKVYLHEKEKRDFLKRNKPIEF